MSNKDINGLTLAKEYYNAYGTRIFQAAEQLSLGLSDRLTVGLAGEGSQCFGFDDEISQDHDFAPGFCIWMNDDDFFRWGEDLQAAYNQLPQNFLGFSSQNLLAPDRLGVMPSSLFYSWFTEIPETDEDWLLIPEANLAAATNGQIWKMGCADFDQARRKLQGFYPESVLRKKLAARAAVMSQAGQYNMLRMMQRGDKVAAQLSAARFTEAAISMLHLLHGSYTPFYKWSFRSLQKIAENSPLAHHCAEEISKLMGAEVLQGAFEITESICSAVAEELRKQGFSQCRSNFLQDHLAEISQGEDFTYGYY